MAGNADVRRFRMCKHRIHVLDVGTGPGPSSFSTHGYAFRASRGRFTETSNGTSIPHSGFAPLWDVVIGAGGFIVARGPRLQARSVVQIHGPRCTRAGAQAQKNWQRLPAYTLLLSTEAGSLTLGLALLIEWLFRIERRESVY